jgi:MFS family permease
MVSLLGTWMQMTAQGFLAFELTRSPAFLGYVGFAAGIPSWLLMLHGGVVADRHPRRTVLIITQLTQMALALALAALIASGWIRPWHLILFAMLTGAVNAYDAPARQSFVLELVDRPDMTNAIALSSTMFNLALTVGPALAGFVYAWVGPALCFLLNGVSFLAVIAALALMKIPASAQHRRRSSVLAELTEGIRYTAREPVVRALILLVGATTLFGFASTTLLPAWAVNILHGDATTNGFLYSARGLGSLVGAFCFATFGHLPIRGKVLTAGTLGFPVFLFLFAGARDTAWAFGLMAVGGMTLIWIFNATNALIQSATPDDLRGRVMAVYSLVFFGLSPLGSLWIGPAAHAWGESAAVHAAAAASMLVAVAALLLAPQLRTLD